MAVLETRVVTKTQIWFIDDDGVEYFVKEMPVSSETTGSDQVELQNPLE